MNLEKAKAIHIAIAILIITTTNVCFGQAKVGTTIAPFLGISVAPRATSMGGAFAAVANDVSTLYYNPGGLSRITGSQLMFSHTEWLLGTSFNWIGFGLNLDGTNAIGASITQLDYGEEDVTTVLQPEGTGEKWSASDLAAAITYTRSLTDRFSIGGSAKYIQQRIYNESGHAFALDVGLLFTTEFKDMKLGMSISNFGTDIRFDGKDLLHRVDLDEETIGHNETIVSKLKTETWPLPLFFRVGLAMDVIKTAKNRLTIAVDAFRPSDNTEIINAGGEFALNEWVFLRAGYKSLFRDDSEEGLTAGAGINIKFGTTGICTLDYGYMDFGLFESVHMYSLKLGF
jgi:hypothetical protein